MSKMVRRIALLILVLLSVFACGETPTPAFVYHTPVEPPMLIETVMLKHGEAARVICYGGPISTSIGNEEVIVYCLER